MEQFRRFANMYFLIVGFIMFIGEYTDLFESAISPWTTWGPLAMVIAISLSVEASADAKRHRNDSETNNALCVILRRSEEIDQQENGERDQQTLKGRDVVVNVAKSYFSHSDTKSSADENTPAKDIVKVGFQKVRRMDIRQGHFVLIKNREMVPADVVLLASSNDQGGAYIETSSIDGETNLKLRNSPQLPKEVLKALQAGNKLPVLHEHAEEEDEDATVFETIEAATKRIARFSALGHPNGRPVTEHKGYANATAAAPPQTGAESVKQSRKTRIWDQVLGSTELETPVEKPTKRKKDPYVSVLVTEPPNASVHTFSGKLTLPPLEKRGQCHDIPLGAENVLLRGAVLRNTEWAIGVAFFTGTDTKLVQNSHKTPPKFSQLDQLMNKTVLVILAIMLITIAYLATLAVSTNRDKFDNLFYVGYNGNPSEKWPYFPATLDAPNWRSSTYNWLQYFLLYVTLLTNFVPLSLYVTVEIVTVCNLWFIYADLDMYDDTSDTRATARSTIITDLGRVEYIFSDKTGTLTQNVMRFKRCSVDGMVFGAPIARARPVAVNDGSDNADDEPVAFHPLRQLLLGRLKNPTAGLEGLGSSTTDDTDRKLTFNAEMFLRVMSLCHTVVVEKDLEGKDEIDDGKSVSSKESRNSRGLFGRKRANTGDSLGTPLGSVKENAEFTDKIQSSSHRNRASSQDSFGVGQSTKNAKGPDGAPFGYAYQAESPDEGALVTAASSIFGFQVVSRDSSGITLRSNFPSHLESESIVSGLQSRSLTLKKIAAQTAAPLGGYGEARSRAPSDVLDLTSPLLITEERKDEKWQILAVNKFDSDRKRMSILLRSPPELGSLPVLFCKGADSAMVDPDVCTAAELISNSKDTMMPSLMQKSSGSRDRGRRTSDLSAFSEDDGNDADYIDEDDWEMASILGVQAHLGDFAKEGLRTLVLGMRVLAEEECEEWLEEYKLAATSMTNRSELLTAAAKKVETNLHIVGATAIEDKLQRGVPHTIAQLEKAGIKLWVLTGDKRETAVEIGYSTHVLTPKMHLTEVPDRGESYVQTLMAMEFIRLIKLGKLVQYQKASLNQSVPVTWKRRSEIALFKLGKSYRLCKRSCLRMIAVLLGVFGLKERSVSISQAIKKSEDEEVNIVDDIVLRQKVRARAEDIIKEWLASEEAARLRAISQVVRTTQQDEDTALASDEPPLVFERATSAKTILKSMKLSGNLQQPELRELSIAHLTANQQPIESDEPPLVDEDTLSLESFVPGAGPINDFDKKKRTILERLFAIDREVRKGRLKKHLSREKLEELMKEDAKSNVEIQPTAMTRGPRALVIEGAALKFLLGDPELESILFAVASNCEAVIACRVSPKQKALLVSLVRRNVKPEPVTLAIGDGANDVGMIQEAHVGIGISGKEGKQAVNASDFAIAQFRFLEELVLIHGRWNFFRLSTVVLFSFYKNAVMAGTLVVYAERTVYSGTPLYDEWVIAMLNFVAAFPILFLGLFDRCLSKDYVKAHPEVFKATRENELITYRTLTRWVALVFVHIFTLYYFTVPQQAIGGGITTAWNGLMRNNDRGIPGDGEGGDLKSIGTVTFSCLIVLFAYKVSSAALIFEIRILHRSIMSSL